jgi:DNA-directed RNA polymerase specialized sigma24 family protein
MTTDADSFTPRRVFLDQITTNWCVVRDPEQFVLRYGPAINAYVSSLVRDGVEADEVVQNFLLKVVERGFLTVDPRRGRFRDYLKVSVKNAVLSHYRARRPRVAEESELAGLAVPAEAEAAADLEWLAHWRQCLLDKAWRALDRHERASPGNLACTVLKAVAERPDDTSDAQAARINVALAGRDGQSLTPAAFRKQLSRARRLFAETLLVEVAQTLDRWDADAVEQELIDLDLWNHVRPLLPDEWRELLVEAAGN